MKEIEFAWVCRNISFNEIERVGLTDEMLLDGSRPSWITSDNCEIIAKILPTGLLDKDGKEIFEGDLVEASIYGDETPQILEVEYRNTCFVIDYEDSESDCVPVGHFVGTLKIIGNIFQDKEVKPDGRNDKAGNDK